MENLFVVLAVAVTVLTTVPLPLGVPEIVPDDKDIPVGKFVAEYCTPKPAALVAANTVDVGVPL